MSTVDEANVHTTKLWMIQRVSDGLMDEPFAVSLCIKYTQSWENAWEDAARSYLVKAEERKQQQEMIHVR